MSHLISLWMTEHVDCMWRCPTTMTCQTPLFSNQFYSIYVYKGALSVPKFSFPSPLLLLLHFVSYPQLFDGELRVTLKYLQISDSAKTADRVFSSYQFLTNKNYGTFSYSLFYKNLLQFVWVWVIRKLTNYSQTCNLHHKLST